MKVEMKIVGGSDLSKRLESLPFAMSRKVQVDALKVGAEPIRRKAEQLAPRSEDQGPHMADHIIVSVPSDRRLESRGLFGGEATVVDVGPQSKFFYGSFLEMGTAFMPAQPFMRPAFDSEVRKSLSLIVSETWAAIRRHLNVGGVRSSSGSNL